MKEMCFDNKEKIRLFHGGKSIVEKPEIRNHLFTKDFSVGFYCTKIMEQAARWSTRYPLVGIVNVYNYTVDDSLKILKFDSMTEEWLDFVIKCRSGEKHDFDIIEGPMSDDKLFNYIQNYIDGRISRKAFWELAKFNYPTHQICFATERSLLTL